MPPRPEHWAAVLKNLAEKAGDNADLFVELVENEFGVRLPPELKRDLSPGGLVQFLKKEIVDRPTIGQVVDGLHYVPDNLRSTVVLVRNARSDAKGDPKVFAQLLALTFKIDVPPGVFDNLDDLDVSRLIKLKQNS